MVIYESQILRLTLYIFMKSGNIYTLYFSDDPSYFTDHFVRSHYKYNIPYYWLLFSVATTWPFCQISFSGSYTLEL